MFKAVITLTQSEYSLLMASLQITEVALGERYNDDILKIQKFVKDKTVWIKDEKEVK